MTEVWKDIDGYEGSYQVSTLGRIHSLDRVDSAGNRRLGKIMKPTVKKYGYYSISLTMGDKKREYLVHRLVAKAFIENKDGYPIINHKDENPSNNCVDNLEWCTYKYNSNYGKLTHEFRSVRLSGEKHGRRKLSQSQVNEIRRRYRYNSKDENTITLAKEYGVSQSQIQNIVTNKSWIL